MNISLNNFGNTNFKVRRQKFGIGSLILMILLGVVFTVVGLFAFRSMLVDKSWTRIQGQVVDVSSSISDGSTVYTPIVQYTVNNQSYKVTKGGGSSAYPNIGDSREVAYNPARPDQSKVAEGNGVKALTLLFPVIGILMVLMAPYLFIKSAKRSSKINNLVQTGQKLQGIIVDIQDTNAGSSKRTYTIVVSATDNSGTVQNYVSDGLEGIGGLAMADFRTNPIPVDVYIDPTNPQNYYVDISDIPTLTPQRIGDLIKSAVSSTQPQTIVQNQTPSPTVQQAQPKTNPPFPPQTPPLS